MMASLWLASPCDRVMLLSPVLQVEVHGRVQVHVCDIQELCVEDAGATGWGDAEGRGWTGRHQVQPLHRLPRRLAERHADHPLNLREGGHLVADGRQRGVHLISAGHEFVLWWMVRVAVVVVGAAVPFALSVPLVIDPVLGSHFKKGHFPSPADWTPKQSLQVALRDVIAWVVVRLLCGVQVLIVAVEPWDEEAGIPWGHSNVRHNFGYRGPLPLFSGVSWHLFKRKRRGGRVTAGSGIWYQCEGG